MQAGLVLYAFVVFGVGAVLLVYFLPGTKLRLPALENALRFCWTCFLKPHTGDASYAQQDALESFYKTQASVYDATRTRLLRGREDMLGLVAAQVTHRVENGEIRPKPIWVDIGGGTGYNIEQMAQFVDVANFFGSVYVVDLSPSLCSVARDRFSHLGWKNVHVLCQDARDLCLSDSSADCKSQSEKKTVNHCADLITMSYSLSMIPEYYSVLDSLSDRLTMNGILGVVDFYVQSKVDYRSRNYLGGAINRHCTWFSRIFWRTWFEADRVGLEGARRDYLEYRFGTILSANARCKLLGFRIPFYVWLGCPKYNAATTSKLAQLDAALTNSPFLSALDQQRRKATQDDGEPSKIRSKAYDSAVVNLASSLPLPSAWYQRHHWRIFYDDTLLKHRKFHDEYLYAFTWEDCRVDSRVLKLNEDDAVLAITSAGDNILAYALESPKLIHAVDLNPAQNHLLELKLAAFTALPYDDVWRLFGEGKHVNFHHLLITKLSPHMSSLAFQYWLKHGSSTFAPTGSGLYSTGGSRHALALIRLLSRLLNLNDQLIRLCEAQTLVEQRELWHRGLRRVLLSRLLSWTVVSNKRWLWQALGVPNAQRALIEKDYMDIGKTELHPEQPRSAFRSSSSPAVTAGVQSIHTYGSGRAIWSYAVNTLDPVINNTLLSSQNHYYLLTLLGRYTHQCHPEYLTRQAHRKLSRADAFNGLRIHTDDVADVIERMKPESLTVAIVMDSMDWFAENDPQARAETYRQVRLLRRALRVGGRVLLRSAGRVPWYMHVFEEENFASKRVNIRLEGECVDRVNMYASTWLCIKKTDFSR